MSSHGNVFICYSSFDQDIALRITKSLEEQGIKCWISTRDVVPGSDFQESIVNAMEESRAIILIFSKNASSSDEIKKEIVLASNMGRVIIPIKVDSSIPTGALRYQLTTRQWVDLTENWSKGISRASEAINKYTVSEMPNVEVQLPSSLQHGRIVAIIIFIILVSASVTYILRESSDTPPHGSGQPGSGTRPLFSQFTIAMGEVGESISDPATGSLAPKVPVPPAPPTPVSALPNTGQIKLPDPAPPPAIIPPPPTPVTPPSPVKSIGQTFRDCENCPEMVVVPAGEFRMGAGPDEPSSDETERPQFEVKISQPFAIGKYSITFTEWELCATAEICAPAKPNDQNWGRGRHPVINVRWHDAQRYIEWLSKKTARPYRLPSESEREYATRANSDKQFSTGDTLTAEQANIDDRQSKGNLSSAYLGRTTEVGSYPPNAFGLYDLHGNVWEWIQDCWHEHYVGAPTDGSAWTADNCSRRGVRGGAWNLSPDLVRSAHRAFYSPTKRSYDLGFRVARSLSPDELPR